MQDCSAGVSSCARMPAMRALHVTTAVLSLALGTSAVRAQTKNPYLDAGVRLYNGLEYEAALEQLKKATGGSPAEDAQIALFRAMVRFELGDNSGAESDFKTALVLDPDAQLPARPSPKMISLFERARTEIAKAPPPKPFAPPSPEVTSTPSPPAPPTTTTAALPPVPAPTAQTSAATTPATPKQSPPQERVIIAKPDPKASGVPRAEPDPVARALPQTMDPLSIAPVVTKPTHRSRLGRMLGGGAVALAGIGLGVGGVYFGVQSADSVKSAQRAEWQRDAVSLQNNARDQALKANLMYGAAAAAVLTGAIIAFTGGGE